MNYVPLRWLMAIAIVYFCAAVFSVGYNHYDEHFQILEFAAYKLALVDAHSLSWEFQEKMRPALQPFLVYTLHQWLPLDPFQMTTFLRFLSGGLAILGAFFTLKTFKRPYSKPLLYTLFFLWFNVFQAVRFSSENWSGQFFLLGFLAMISFKRFFLSGLLLGLAFHLRYQTGLMIAGLLVWMVFFLRPFTKKAILFSIGAIISLAAGIVVDHWFYGEWVLAPYNYFYQNLILHKVDGFGVSPFWFYFSSLFIKATPLIGLYILLLLVLLFVWAPLSPLSFVIVPFLLIHCLIGHKELRFLFPLLPLIPLVFGELNRLPLFKHGLLAFKRVWIRRLLILSNTVALLVIMFKPADNYISLYKKIYRNYPTLTTLYSAKGENPYHLVLPLFYYRRPSLKVKEVSSLPLQSKGESLFLSKTLYTPKELGFAWSLVDQSYPLVPEKYKRVLKNYYFYKGAIR